MAPEPQDMEGWAPVFFLSACSYILAPSSSSFLYPRRCPRWSPCPHAPSSSFFLPALSPPQVQGRPMLLVLLHFGTQFHIRLQCISFA